MEKRDAIIFETLLGNIKVFSINEVVVLIKFTNKKVKKSNSEILNKSKHQIKEYLSGNRTVFNIDIKFDLYLDSESEYFEQIDDLTSNNSIITPKVLLASLMISFCNQYLSYLEDSITKNSRIILGGGIPNKVPVIADIIEKKMK